MEQKWVSVKEAYNREYRMVNYVPSSNMANDQNSKTYLENEARKKVLGSLDSEDRYNVNSCVKRLKECCIGVSLGDAAALQIIEHIGVFLAEAERAS